MEIIKRARQKIQKYPKLVAQCSDSAKLYAACVTANFNVKQNACEKEFLEFKKCLAQAAAKSKKF